MVRKNLLLKVNAIPGSSQAVALEAQGYKAARVSPRTYVPGTAVLYTKTVPVEQQDEAMGAGGGGVAAAAAGGVAAAIQAPQQAYDAEMDALAAAFAGGLGLGPAELAIAQPQIRQQLQQAVGAELVDDSGLSAALAALGLQGGRRKRRAHTKRRAHKKRNHTKRR